MSDKLGWGLYLLSLPAMGWGMLFLCWIGEKLQQRADRQKAASSDLREKQP